MNKMFLYTISGLIVAVGTFGGLFYRDVVLASKQEDIIDLCVPYSLDVSKIKQSSFTISWETKSDCSGYVVFGDVIDETNRMVVGEDSLKKVSNQNVVVDNLLPDSTYYFYIISGDTVYGDKNGLASSVNTSKY